MNKKKDILKNVFIYSFSQYAAQFIGFFTAVFMRRFLGPFFTGIWNLIGLIRDYARYTHLGTTHTLFYRYPMLKGEKNRQEAERIKSVVFNFMMTGSVLASIGLIGYALIFKSSLRIEVFTGLLVLSVLLLCQRLYTYYITLLRVNKEFRVLSKVVLFDSIVNFLLVLIIVGRFRLYGLYLVATLMPVLNLIFIRRYVDYHLRYSFDFEKLAGYIKYGIPLFIKSIFTKLLYNIDRIMIAAMLGLQQLGFYSIALMTRTYSSIISSNFTHVLTPYFLEEYGESGNKAAAPYVITTSLITSYFMALLLGAIFICGPLFVVLALPKFTPGINAMKIFLLTTFFSTVSPYSSDYLVAVNKRLRLLAVVIFVLLLNVTFNLIFIKLGYGIAGVASASAICASILFIIVIVYALSHFESLGKSFKFLGLVLFPLFYIALILIGLDSALGIDYRVSVVLKKLSLFIVAIIPLLFYLNKRTSIINIIFKLMRDRFRKEWIEEER